MSDRPPLSRHVFAVSDATGGTCEQVVQAALSQFRTTEVVLERIPNARTRAQVIEILDRAAKVEGVVIYTMVSPELRHVAAEEGRRRGVSTVDILGPILSQLSNLLEISPLAEPGLLRALRREYYQRIDAVDYTVKHDDGLGMHDLGEAEIVLVGVSRTSKTPVSMYLSYRGWRVANVPIVCGMEPPAALFEIDQRRIVAFTTRLEFLQALREDRARRMGGGGSPYIDPVRIREELTWAARLFSRAGWPVIDVAHKSIEETATEVAREIGARTGLRKGAT